MIKAFRWTVINAWCWITVQWLFDAGILATPATASFFLLPPQCHNICDSHSVRTSHSRRHVTEWEPHMAMAWIDGTTETSVFTPPFCWPRFLSISNLPDRLTAPFLPNCDTGCWKINVISSSLRIMSYWDMRKIRQTSAITSIFCGDNL